MVSKSRKSVKLCDVDKNVFVISSPFDFAQYKLEPRDFLSKIETRFLHSQEQGVEMTEKNFPGTRVSARPGGDVLAHMDQDLCGFVKL